MQKNISLLIIVSFLLIQGCSEDDSGSENNSFPPTITLNGDERDTIILNSTYTELGATAKNSDGVDISSKVNISGFVDPDKSGQYEKKYAVTDSKGITSKTLTRDILVRNQADYLEGTYLATHKCSSSGASTPDFSTQIVASTETNNQITFSRLNPITQNIKAVVSLSQISIPNAFDNQNNQYNGSGVITNNELEITLNTNVLGFGNCTIKLPR